MISTIQRTEMTITENAHYQTDCRIAKPISVQDYNENRGFADKSDMQMPFSEFLHKLLK
jgi:hypothetical protein